MTEKNKAQIIEWLYVNDGGFSSKNEWRINLIKFLDSLVTSEILGITRIE